jgi:endonuclease III-like uncharacterized protein
MGKKIDPQKLISFLQNEEGFDTDELLGEMVEGIDGLGARSIDELMVFDGDQPVMDMREFSRKLYDKIVEGLVNVINTED